MFEKNIKAVALAISWIVNGVATSWMEISRRCSRYTTRNGSLDIRVNGHRAVFPAQDMAELAWADTAGDFPLWAWSREDVTQTSVCFSPPHGSSQGREHNSTLAETDEPVMVCEQPRVAWYIFFAPK